MWSISWQMTRRTQPRWRVSCCLFPGTGGSLVRRPAGGVAGRRAAGPALGLPVRRVIETLADTGSFLELQRIYGRSIITGFIRLEGQAGGADRQRLSATGRRGGFRGRAKAARFCASVMPCACRCCP